MGMHIDDIIKEVEYVASLKVGDAVDWSRMVEFSHTVCPHILTILRASQATEALSNNAATTKVVWGVNVYEKGFSGGDK